MFSWLKSRKTRCIHLKRFGEPALPNMVEIVRFSPYKKDRIGYAVTQCSECGKRAFSCIGLHLMGPKACEMIDAFIEYRVDPDAFAAFLAKEMAWSKHTTTQPREGEQKG